MHSKNRIVSAPPVKPLVPLQSTKELLVWKYRYHTLLHRQGQWLYINYQLDALITIYPQNTILLYMFRAQVLIFRRIQLYICSLWYCHSLWEFLVACRYTAWVRTDWRGKFSLKLCTDRPPRTLTECDSTICCTCTVVSSWRWALELETCRGERYFMN